MAAMERKHIYNIRNNTCIHANHICYAYLSEVPRAGLALVTSTEVPFACKCKQARGVFEPEKSLTYHVTSEP